MLTKPKIPTLFSCRCLRLVLLDGLEQEATEITESAWCSRGRPPRTMRRKVPPKAVRYLRFF